MAKQVLNRLLNSFLTWDLVILYLVAHLSEDLTGLYYLAIDVILYLTYKEKLKRTGVRNVNNDNAVESVSQLLHLCLLACR